MDIDSDLVDWFINALLDNNRVFLACRFFLSKLVNIETHIRPSHFVIITHAMSLPPHTLQLQEERVLAMSFTGNVIESLRDALRLPEAESRRCNWELVTETLRYWIGGLADGDGCITADKKHGLRVLVKQAEHGWDSLYALQSILGGCIYDNMDATDVWQAQKTWSLCGVQARMFCRHMIPYTKMKRPQLLEALKYHLFELKAMQMQPVLSRQEDDGTTNLYGSIVQASQMTGSNDSNLSRVTRSRSNMRWQLLGTRTKPHCCS